MIRLTLPWDVLVSDNKRNQRRGGKAHSWEYKRCKEAIRLHAMDQVRGDRPHFTEGPLWWRMEFHQPDNRRRDCGNYRKAIEDAFNGIVWADDSMVRDVGYLIHTPDGSEPRVEIRVGQGLHMEAA